MKNTNEAAAQEFWHKISKFYDDKGFYGLEYSN